MVGPRTRTLGPSANAAPGYYQNWYGTTLIGTYNGSNLTTFYGRCQDTTELPPYTDPHTLLLYKQRVEPLRLNGEMPNASYTKKFYGYNPTNMTGYQYAAAPPPVDWLYWKSKALAAANPFKPKVDLPLFLFELKDMPRMLRQLGDVLNGRSRAKDIPGGYLAYQFGWAPLFSDLSDLVNFGKAFNDKMRVLRKAQNGERRRLKLGETTSNSQWVYSASGGTPLSYNLSVAQTKKLKVWATIRVRLKDPILVEDMPWEAVKATLGLDLSAATIWNMIPWTWLMDYFFNIGTMMEARRGYSRWSHHDLFIMATDSLEDKVIGPYGQVPGSMTYSGGVRNYTRKQRSFHGSDPNLGVTFKPWLSGQQMSILGALVTAKALKGVR